MFRDLLLEQIRLRLNLCATELFQMKKKELESVGIENTARIVGEIIQEIADGEIVSAHFTREEAVNCVRLLDYLGNNLSGESAQETLRMVDHIQNKCEFDSEV